MFLAQRPPAFHWETLRESGGGSAVLADEGLDCTVEVYMLEESEEGVTVL